MRNIFLSFVVGSLAVLMSSCALLSPESDCVACQDAIDHMAGKISSLSCNPNVMENAWNGIREDCGVLADLYVGYMTERCSEGVDFTPDCVEKGSLTSSGLKLRYNYVGGIDSVYVIVKLENNNDSESFTIKSKDTRELIYGSIDVSEGKEVQIIVLDPYTDEELVSESHQFTFERDQNWWNTRTVKISYFSNDQKYYINFEMW